MKQKATCGGGAGGSRTAGGGGREIWMEDEIDVAETLVNLRKLFERSEFLSKYTFTWGRRKKRSVLVSKSPPSPAENQRRNCSESGLKKVKLTEATKSPSTPLSFLPSCSDSDGADKSKQQSSLKKNSDKKTRDEFLEKLDGMTQQRELLRKELEAMGNLHQELTATNLELKAKRQQISLSRNTHNLQLWKNTMKMNLGQQQQHCQQFIVDQNNGKLLPMIFPICSSNSNNNGGLGLVNQTAPRGIPDLNVSAEETFGFVAQSQPLDLHRAMAMDNDQRVRAAAARKRRMMRMKENKNSVKLSRACR